MRDSSRSRMAVAVAIVGAGIASGQAWAGITVPDIEIDWVVGDDDPMGLESDGIPNPDGSYNFAGDMEGDGWTVAWNLNADTDPFIEANLVVQNNALVTQNFVFMVTLPIDAIAEQTVIGGSVGATITADVDGGTLSNIMGTPAWTGIIDDTDVATLLGPLDLTVDPFLSDTESSSFGTPIPNQLGPVGASSIGIRLEFMLTPGDQAAFTSVFVVEAIPAPGALALLGMAGLATRRRRRPL